MGKRLVIFQYQSNVIITLEIVCNTLEFPLKDKKRHINIEKNSSGVAKRNF